MSQATSQATPTRRRWTALAPWSRPALPASGETAPATGGRPARTPTVLQMEAVECGAASLAIILAHHGRYVPLEELRVACGVSRDGSKASNVLKAARTYGLAAKGFKKEPAQLRQLAFPAIVHWNFNHFLVLEGFEKGKVRLNDPAQGPRVVSEEEFDQSFTGVVLVFERTPGFQAGGDRRGLLASLAPRLAGSRLALLFVIAAGLSLVIPGLVVPTFSRVFLDSVLVKGLTAWLRPLLILMGATAVLQFALTWLQQRYLLRLETKVSLSTSARFFWHVLRLPVQFFNQRYAGEIGNRVAINDKVARLLSGDLATTVLNFVVIAFYGAMMLQYDVWLALLSVVIAAINIAVLRAMSRRRTDLTQRVLQDGGKMMGTAMGGLQTIESLKATGSEGDFFARWAGYQAKVINSSQQISLTSQVLSNVPQFLLSLNMAILLGFGGLRVMNGHLSMGMLMAFQALMMAFVSPVNRLVSLGGTLQEVKGDMNRLDDVLRAAPDPAAVVEMDDGAALEGDDAPVKLGGYLELNNVTFGYSPLDPPLIENFSLSLKPGSRVALVGGSGCGKSTVSKLVSGLFEPWSGEILFDGKARTAWPRAVMANSMAIVDQEIFMFEGSVRDNVTLWDSTVPESGLLQACRDACIHDEVAARPGGYASAVEEGGTNFSGGQRQRLEIARALSVNPTILVLDEATSALDPATEKTIDDNLRRRGCTCLIVAHRLSTIRDCDEIIVLHQGKIVQRGTHEQLAALPGYYARLISSE
ncbi:MAG TPA: NHLP family bacteriocin export ABC transporter peptidase/permease/ATPase subunit [Longimicrobium sp.]|nr:NHLP family bacteriocin export ABC transporter peptidase/permease/ATPase subunit [Longimicrobium sp.]